MFKPISVTDRSLTHGLNSKQESGHTYSSNVYITTRINTFCIVECSNDAVQRELHGSIVQNV